MQRSTGSQGAPDTASASATAPTDERARPGAARSERPTLRQGVVTLYPRGLDEVPGAWVVRAATSIGRSRQSAIRLRDARVSAAHAVVEPRAGGLLVRDGGSRHGTFVNGGVVAAE